MATTVSSWRRCFSTKTLSLTAVLVSSRPSQDELEAITMNPTRTKSDQEWLESHVRSVCGGQMPPLIGPYAIPYLVSQLEGMRSHLIDGFQG